MNEARCMKCKKNIEIKDVRGEVTKNGLKINKGICPVCGTKVARIVGKADK